MYIISPKFTFYFALIAVIRIVSVRADISNVKESYPTEYFVGDFMILVDNLQVTVRRKNYERILWLSPSTTEPFVFVGQFFEPRPPILNGNFQMEESELFMSISQTIDRVDYFQNKYLNMHGLLGGISNNVASYSLSFSESTLSANQLHFRVNITSTESENAYNRVFLNYWCDSDESFHGFGESFTNFNMVGRRIPILVSEQGVGRGVQPITDYLNNGTEGVGGHWYTTYAPKPMYLTNHNRSMLFENSEVMYFNLTETGLVQVEVWSQELIGNILFGTSMKAIVEEITKVTGRMSSPPDWSQRGAIVGLEGGTDAVTAIVQKLMDGGVPIAGVWLQDWVGLRHSYDGDRLIWNWEVNYNWYPDWQVMVQGWSAQGAKVLTYLNPFFSDPSNFTKPRHNFFIEGIENNYFVRNSSGLPYRMRSLSIEFCMLDLTNPDAVIWMKNIIKNYSLGEAQSSGWMADFGEYLPFDSVLYSGESASKYHNRYPEDWAKLTREALTEAGVEDDVLYFMRSAWIQSPKYNSIFWEGDQLISWDSNDGLKNCVLAALSSGISGHAITHTDIGGYNVAIYNDSVCNGCTYLRTEELLSRWTEMATFGAGLFRTHIGSSTTKLNFQVYDSDSSIKHFAEFANIYAELESYRVVLIAEAIDKGLPLMRPYSMNYAYDAAAWQVEEAYLFGDEYIVAPCMEKNKTSVVVYFPALSGRWIHLWGGNIIDSSHASGKTLTVPAPVGFPPVFYKETSASGQMLREYVVKEGYDQGYVWVIPDDENSDSSIEDKKVIRIVALVILIIFLSTCIFCTTKQLLSPKITGQIGFEYSSVSLLDGGDEQQQKKTYVSG